MGEQRQGGAAEGAEPGLDELATALAARTRLDGTVPAGVAGLLARERGWSGRAMDVLGVLTASAHTMGYLTGGRRPEEVATWLAVWVDSPLSVEEMRRVVAAGGWDPEPFAVLVREGLLDELLSTPDGEVRRVRGELAGGWVSDELTLADDAEIVARVRAVLAGSGASEAAAG